MAKLLKHFGLGGKKSVSTSRSEFTNSTTQKSNSVNELGSCKYQSSNSNSGPASANNTNNNNCLVNVGKSSPDYDTRSLKLNLDDVNKNPKSGSSSTCSTTNNVIKNQNSLNGHHHQQPTSKMQCSSLQKNTPSKKSDVPVRVTVAGGQHNPHLHKQHKHQQHQQQQQSPQNEEACIIIDKPDILEEYSNPHDLTTNSSVATIPANDDDYSTPYDEVNKVLKDIKAHRSTETLQNGLHPTISNNTSATNNNNNDNNSNSSCATKVPLKLTSPSTITTIHIKQKRIKIEDTDNTKDSKDINSKDNKKIDNKVIKDMDKEDDKDINSEKTNDVNKDIKETKDVFQNRDVPRQEDDESTGKRRNAISPSLNMNKDDGEDDDDDECDDEDDDDGEDGDEKREEDEMKNHDYTVLIKTLSAEDSTLYDRVNIQKFKNGCCITKHSNSQEVKDYKSAQDNSRDSNHYSSLTGLSYTDPTNNSSADKLIACNILMDNQPVNDILLSPANENEDVIISSQSYSSNCTSGGLVTIVTTNHLKGFEPIDCDLVLAVNKGQDLNELTQIQGVSSAHATDQLCQANVGQSDGAGPNCLSQSNCDKLNRVIKSNRIRPKSDGILISQSASEPSYKQLKCRSNKNRNNNNLITNNNNNLITNNNNNLITNNNNNNKNVIMNGAETCVKMKRNIKKGMQTSTTSSTITSSTTTTTTSSSVAQNIDGLPHQGWYHGSIGRVEAERLLENQPVGSYLVRVSESNSKDYSLSLKNQSGYLHIKIVHQPADGFILGQFSQPFDSISSMIGFYKSNKLPIRGNENLKLLRPMIVEVL